MVGAQLATLPQLWRRILIARYSPRASPCECGRTCCRGYKLNGRWLIEVAWLSATIFLDLDLPLLNEKQKIKDAMVIRYFGQKDRNMEELARQAGVPPQHHERVQQPARNGAQACGKVGLWSARGAADICWTGRIKASNSGG